MIRNSVLKKVLLPHKKEVIDCLFEKPLAVHPACRAFASSIRWCSSHSQSHTPEGESKEKKHSSSSTPGVEVTVSHGLPHLTIPLPSRRELCRFTLRPVTHCVGDLISQLQHEDKGIDRVALSTKDDVRISSSTSIESLMMNDFILVINDVSYPVKVPATQRITLEEMDDLSDVRQLVNKLYSALNVDQHQLLKERGIITKIEEIQAKLGPLETKRKILVKSAERRTAIMSWTGLGYMALQFGFLARLTWWEYSWDIMEPVTYFVTYGTAIGAYAYYVVTRQDFLLPDVRDRQFLINFYKRARKVRLNVDEYNNLKVELSKLEGDLQRLRDPLALNLPTVRLENDPSVHDALSKAHISIKNIFSLKKSKP